MKAKLLSREWEKILAKGMPKIDIEKGDINWLIELLGWKKDVERRK